VRHPVVLATTLFSVLLALCAGAPALDPSLDVSQYAHTAWRIREGFTKGYIDAMAQTPDGYLWLGTEFGLLRFDGVRAVSWNPPSGEQLPSNDILSLLASRDGGLWIGTSKGLARWKDGKIIDYPQLGGFYVHSLLEDREGTIWAGGFGVPTGRLCAIETGIVHCDGQDGTLGMLVLGLYEDSRGNLWVGVKDGLWRWKPGAAKFYPLPGQLNGIRALAEDTDGSLLIGTHDGIRRLVGDKAELAYPISGNGRLFEAENLLRDRDGSLWITTVRHGLMRLHQGKTDVFTQADGLSGTHSVYVLNDREGNVWVSTFDGLDRFREYAVVTFTADQGLLGTTVASVLADKDGSVWLSTTNGLNRWNQGQITIFGKSNGKRKPDGQLDGNNPNSLFQDSQRRIWASTPAAIGYLDNDRFIEVVRPARGGVRAIAEDAPGSLWISDLELGLLHLQQGNVVQQIPTTALGRQRGDTIDALVPDRLHGGLWLGFFQGGIAYFADGGLRASYSTANGLGAGRVSDLRLDSDGTLWAATQGGLSRVKNGRVAALTIKNGLPCDGVHWDVEDDEHFLWVYMPCGLVRMARSELDAWASAVDQDQNARHTVRFELLNTSDGVQSRATGGGYVPTVTKAMDGRLWFVNNSGVSVIDPRHLVTNKIPPPVHFEQIMADHKTCEATPDANGQVRLPPQIRDLQIDYTALSLVAPEKVLFRYKLEGWDRDWQDAGTRRQAFYNNLAPRNYRFRVMACNNSGVWNEAGASLDFFVAPAYYQTNWFRLSLVAAFLAALWGLYQFRLRQLAREFNMRLDERVLERTRIARELHDTLLQNVQGLILKFHAIGKRIPPADPTRQEIEKTLDFADQVMAEGRDRVRNLRSSTIGFGGLPKAFQQLVEEAAPNRSSTFKMVVEGTVLELHPIIREETYSIGREALINALTHSEANNIEAEITYESREFRLRIRDDGRGIDPAVLEKGGRDDHWGLQGMRERAKRIGAKLDLWSRPGSGTEVELTVPASTAYRSPGRKSTDSESRISAAG